MKIKGASVYILCLYGLFLILTKSICVTWKNDSFKMFTSTDMENNRKHVLVQKAFDYFLDRKYENKKCFHLTWNHTYVDLKLEHLQTAGCKRFVNVLPLQKGIGSEVFAVAALFSIAYQYDLIPIVSSENEATKYFALPNVVKYTPKELEQNVIYRFQGSSVFTREILYGGSNMTLEGFFPPLKVFKDTHHIIRNVLRLKSSHLLKASKLITTVHKQGQTPICIELPSIDWLVEKNYESKCEQFLEKATLYFRIKYSNVKFFLIIDDRARYRDIFNLNATVSPFEDPGDNIALMVLSSHVIITEASLGWWGAWLSGGETIYNKDFPRRQISNNGFLTNEDYYPPSWIPL